MLTFTHTWDIPTGGLAVFHIASAAAPSTLSAAPVGGGDFRQLTGSAHVLPDSLAKYKFPKKKLENFV